MGLGSTACARLLHDDADIWPRGVCKMDESKTLTIKWGFESEFHEHCFAMHE